MGLLQRLFTKLRLRVNESKSAVDLGHATQASGLLVLGSPGARGETPGQRQGPCAMKDRVRAITRRTGGRSIEQVVEELRGYLAGGRSTTGWRRLRGSSANWTNGSGTVCERSTSSTGNGARPSIGSCGAGDSPTPQRPGWRPTVGAGGITRPWSSTSPSRSATSTSWGFPGWPRDLNLSNRPVRTRMPGGVAGAP